MSKILIVEDNCVNRELLRELLEMDGHCVAEAVNGREALDSLGRELPEAVLLDLNMPVLDGFGAIREIRQHGQFRALPVVAVTAYAMVGDRERTLNAGFDGYLSKPIDLQSLRSELRRVLATAPKGSAATSS